MSKLRFVYVVIALLACSLVAYWTGIAHQRVVADEGESGESHDLHSLFEELASKELNDRNFSYRVRFLSSGFDEAIEIQGGFSYDVYISDVSSDYVCFTRQTSQTLLTQCFTYHNIGAIMFEE